MIKVLVVDDSAVVRRILVDVLGKAPDIEVVGTAADPYIARDKILKLSPDVLTLDIEMPRMDGITFLGKLMRHRPMPVVVVSSLSPEGSHNAVKALELGAVEVVSKPGTSFSVAEISHVIVEKVRAAAVSRTRHHRKRIKEAQKSVTEPVLPSAIKTTEKVIAIGASTGGTEAIKALLAAMPRSSPGMVIVQHMPEQFTTAFAERLNHLCRMDVKEAEGGEAVRPGLALIAPGNRHMRVRRSGAHYLVDVVDGPYVHHQRPSVEVLMNSMARHVGMNAVGVILTGMGSDGAGGLLAMKEAGAYTIAQDEKTSVVYGMPKAAVDMGAVEKVLPLDRIPEGIINALASITATRGAAKSSDRAGTAKDAAR